MNGFENFSKLRFINSHNLTLAVNLHAVNRESQKNKGLHISVEFLCYLKCRKTFLFVLSVAVICFSVFPILFATPLAGMSWREGCGQFDIFRPPACSDVIPTQ